MTLLLSRASLSTGLFHNRALYKCSITFTLTTLTFVNINLTTRRMFGIILYFEHSTFGVILSWSREVGSQKMDPCTSLKHDAHELQHISV